MAAPVADLGTGVLETFAGLEDDERLAGQGLAAAFAAAFPSLPADSDIPSLTTSAGSATAAYALKIPIPKIRACGGWSRRSQVPEDRYIDFKCPACDDGRRFFGWLTD